MSTALITAPKYELVLANRSYPACLRSEEPEALPEFFESLANTLVYAHYKKAQTTREILSYYQAFVSHLNEGVNALSALVSAVCRANIIGGDSELLEKNARKVAGLVGDISYRPELVLRSESAVLPPAELDTYMGKVYRSMAKAYCQEIVRVLDAMVDAEQVGLIDWQSPTVCRFHYFLSATDRRVVATRENMLGTEQDIDTTTSHFRYEEDLVEARMVDPGVAGFLPYRISKLLERIPPALKQHVRVVFGTKIFETIIGRSQTHRTTQAIPRPVAIFDPAIVLGPFVLAGWDKQEQDRCESIERYHTSEFNETFRGAPRVEQHIRDSFKARILREQGIVLL